MILLAVIPILLFCGFLQRYSAKSLPLDSIKQ